MITWLPDLATIYTEDGAQSFASAQGGQGDVRCALDLVADICPERWLLNGREVRFDWYADDVCAMFEGAVE